MYNILMKVKVGEIETQFKCVVSDLAQAKEKLASIYSTSTEQIEILEIAYIQEVQ